jgi:hypothetical protein
MVKKRNEETMATPVAAQKAVGAAPTAVEAGEPLMKTCGERKPRMADIMLLLLLAARPTSIWLATRWKPFWLPCRTQETLREMEAK